MRRSLNAMRLIPVRSMQRRPLSIVHCRRLRLECKPVVAKQTFQCLFTYFCPSISFLSVMLSFSIHRARTILCKPLPRRYFKPRWSRYGSLQKLEGRRAPFGNVHAPTKNRAAAMWYRLLSKVTSEDLGRPSMSTGKAIWSKVRLAAV